MKKSRVLILGASYANTIALREMAAMDDVELIIADGNSNSPGKKISENFVTLDITDSASVLAAAEQWEVKAIYAMNDFAVRSAAYACNRMRLKGLSMGSAHAALDKGTMREIWRSYGLPQPEFKIIKSISEIEQFASEHGFPLIIKPVDSGGGGRGVYTIRDSSDIQAGYEAASAFLKRNDRMIVEKFIEGIETSVEIAYSRNKSRLIAFSDKFKPEIKSRVATQINYPGDFSDKQINCIQEISENALHAIGITEGIGHVELIVNGDSLQLVELGARAGGGHTFHPIASHVAGINYPQWVLRFLLDGEGLPDVDKYRGAAYHFFFSEQEGIIKEIEGVDKAENMENVYCVESWRKPGDRIFGLKNSMERIGCVVTLAETRNLAFQNAADAVKAINILID